MNEAAAPAPVSTRRRRWLLAAGLLAFAAGGLALWALAGDTVATDDAYVKADKVNVGAEVAGVVAAVDVAENQPVVRGDVLFRLDVAPFAVALRQAEADVLQARLSVASLRAAHGQKLSALASARAELRYRETSERRLTELRRQGVVSQVMLDDAAHATALARNRLVELQHDVEEALARLDGRADIAVAEHPAVRAADAQRDKARLDVERATVRAPLAGIASKVPQPGQYAMPGLPLISIVAQDDTWVEANFKESELADVRAGLPVSVTVDTYPGLRWTAEVASIGQATGAEFALLPPQNATGNWVKVVQRIPVRIRLQHFAGEPALRAGMSATVRVDTRADQPGVLRRVLALAGFVEAAAAPSRAP